MKITLEPASDIQTVNGTPYRLWKGKDEHGVEVHAHIMLISLQTHDPAVAARFCKELADVGFAKRGTHRHLDLRHAI